MQSEPTNVSKEEVDKLYFVSFCVEQYKKHIAATGEFVLEQFEQYGVVDYLHEFYDVLHTENAKWLIEEIDNYIKAKQ